MAVDEDRTSVPVVGVGASAGGLEAIREMLAASSADNGMAFVVVQHLDPNHESLLAELLSRQSPMPVKQVAGGERVDANHVYIIPPGQSLSIRDGCLTLTEFEQPRGLRRPIDDFFASLANDQEGNAACVILSGTGADGSSGLRAIKEHGGLCVAQEPETARYDGMPVSAIGTGLVDFVRQPADIIDTLREFFERRQGYDEREDVTEILAEHVDEMCVTLREVIGHDFSGYKHSTLIRRIERRMQVLGIDAPYGYLKHIRDDPDECEALFRDLLINVTRFFRDPEMFEDLDRLVIRPLIESTPHNREIRVWVPGCSSGEEAYSIAVLFADALRSRMPRPLVQIFATDIDEAMLAIAREGTYPIAALADIPERLRTNFTIGREGVFQMSPKVRDLIRFSNHSLVKDPPFSKLDLISCRNLLIYMGDKLQQQVFPLFQYALAEDGYLFLGPSESIGRHEELFSVVKQKSRIFKRREGSVRYPITLPTINDAPRRRPMSKHHKSNTDTTRLTWEESLSVRQIIDRYAPPSMVVDADGAVIKTSGKLAKYFEYPEAGRDVTFAISLARPGLREILSQLIRQAVQSRKKVVAKDVTVRAEFGSQQLDVIADPLPDETVLLIFRDNMPFETSSTDQMLEEGSNDGEIQFLQDELRVTRHRLRGTVEELETANEELKSSNEEMMSMNEELQSTNEELTTVNDELKTKVDQLTTANSDLRNFFESTQLAVVVLDKALTIRSFTDAATEIFPLQQSDRGRALSDVATSLDHDVHLLDASSVLHGKTVSARTLTSHGGKREWALRVLPYRLQDGTVDGATIVLNEITEAQRIQRDLNDERERLELAVQVAKIGVWEYLIDSGETILDDSEIYLLGADPDDSNIESIMDLIVPEDRPAVEASLRRAITGESDFSASFRVNHADGEVRHLRGLGRLVEGSSPARMIGVTFDVTAEARLAEQREFLLTEMNHRVKNLFAIIAGFVTGAARDATTPQELALDIRQRIEALGRSHSLSQGANNSTSVSLSSLIDAALEPYEHASRVGVGGPTVRIENAQLTPLSLILHEWATNSSKYGALGDTDGKVAVSWELSDDNEVTLFWEEDFHQPRDRANGSSKGFGSRLIRFSMQQLDGTLEEDKGETSWSAKMTFAVSNKAHSAESKALE